MKTQAYILRIFKIKVCAFSINVKVKFHSNILETKFLQEILHTINKKCLGNKVQIKFRTAVLKFITWVPSKQSSEQTRFIFKKHRFHLHYASWNPTQITDIHNYPVPPKKKIDRLKTLSPHPITKNSFISSFSSYTLLLVISYSY